MTQNEVLGVQNLKVHFPVRVGGILRGKYQPLRAVDDVSFQLFEGETLGVVGESGCGKSTLGRAALMLNPPTDGEVYWNQESVGQLSDKKLRSKRQDFQIVFQDSLSSLNPRMTIYDVIAEPIRSFQPETKEEAIQKQVAAAMERVGLLPNMMMRYPHEFSGGQCQRISIARAVILKPRVLILDEPVSALDVSIQAQIINLLKDLQADMGLSFFFISHDLSVVRYMCERIIVMYLGKIVEIADRETLFNKSRHPYTQMLISAIPDLERATTGKGDPSQVAGELPSPLNPPQGCRFQTRCAFASETCKTLEPVLEKLDDGNHVACHHWRSVSSGVPEQI